MALRQLLGITCLALHLLANSVGVYGITNHSQELHLKPQDPSWNSTDHLGSGVSAAGTSSIISPPSSEGTLAPQTTPPSDQPLQNAAAVVFERPRPLEILRPLHVSVHGNQATLSTNALISSSRATFTPTGAGFSFSTDKFVDASSATRGSSTASQSRSASASAYTNGLRIVRPSDATRARDLASGRNKTSILAWSPPSSIASLAPARSAIQTAGLDSAIKISVSVSAGLKYNAAASGTGESPSPVEFLDSIKNRTENMTRSRLHPWLGPRPQDVRLVYLPLLRSGIGSHATSGALIQKFPLATAIRSDRVSSTNRTGHYLGAASDRQYPSNCSGLVTSTAHVRYETVTSTILINETVTLGPNATTPLPVFITPPAACQTVTVSCKGMLCPSSNGGLPKFPLKPLPLSPYTPPTFTSTLLVTKKSPAVVQQLSTVGHLFGPSVPTPQAAQPNSDGQQAAGQDSGSSNPEMSTQSDNSSPSNSDNNGQSPEKSTPQKNPTDDDSQSTSSNNQNSNSQKPGAGSSGAQSTGSDDQTASNRDQSNGAGSNNRATSNHGGSPSNGDVSGHGDSSSNDGTSNSGSTNTGGSPSSLGKVTDDGGASNHEGTTSNEGTSSNGGDSDSGSTNAGGGTSINGAGVSNNGASSSGEGSASNAGGISNNGAASNNGAGSINEDGPEPDAGRSADLHEIQYVPSIVMVGNLPVSIASNAVIVGAHTVNAGAPPTTVITNGQTIAINPSQIVAQGETISIQAAVTSLPAAFATVGNVPVMLRPEVVAIGSKTFEHGPSPTSVIYDGQTYSWDASHLVGAGATVTFPSVDAAPRVTAGGQVFSVYPSQLKASGRNIPLPNTAKASPFVYKGQTFSVNPSQIIAPDTSITLPPPNKVTPFVYIDHSLSVDVSQFMARSTTIPLSSGSGIVTYNGQILTIKPSEVIGPSTTIALSALDDSAASLTAVTTEGLTFSIGPSAAVVGSSTYSFVPGKAAATIMTDGEAVLVGSNGVQFGNVHVPMPTLTPNFSIITQGDLTFSVAPSEVVVGGHTDTIHSDMTPITTIVNGHTISIGPEGVGLAATTIPLPTPKPSFSMAIEGDLTFSVAPSEVVVKGKTYSIASNKAPITTAIDGQIVTIGPKGVHLEGTTVNLPVIQTPISVTADGLTFLVGATDAVISGTTYAIGSGAPLQTVVVGSQTIEIGSAGVMLPSTTIAPEQTPIAVTADGLTFSVDSTEAVINGTTYAIGSGAMAKTILEGSKTIILGTDGVALPSTTIRPWSNAMQTGFSSILGTSAASSAATASGPLTPIVTGKEGDKKHAAGISTRVPSSSTLLALVLGISCLGLRLN